MLSHLLKKMTRALKARLLRSLPARLYRNSSRLSTGKLNSPIDFLPPSVWPNVLFVFYWCDLCPARSSLTCPHCQKQSNTFDPFLCISLPIPLPHTRCVSLTPRYTAIDLHVQNWSPPYSNCGCRTTFCCVAWKVRGGAVPGNLKQGSVLAEQECDLVG